MWSWWIKSLWYTAESTSTPSQNPQYCLDTTQKRWPWAMSACVCSVSVSPPQSSNALETYHVSEGRCGPVSCTHPASTKMNHLTWRVISWTSLWKQVVWSLCTEPCHNLSTVVWRKRRPLTQRAVTVSIISFTMRKMWPGEVITITSNSSVCFLSSSWHTL